MSDAPRWAAISALMNSFLEQRHAEFLHRTPRDTARLVERLAHEHDRVRRDRCLNLNAAENTMSRKARALLNSDLATRVTEGWPGDKTFPPAPQNRYVDEIEASLILTAREMFRCEYVEWRPVSTSMVNAATIFALTRPGDAMLVQSMEAGANSNYQADVIPALYGLHVHPMAHRAPFELDLDTVRDQARRVAPTLMVVGGSYVLFPYPIAELRSIADEVGAVLVLDAAHVSLYLATGHWPNALAEGAHAVTLSTHKIMGGPVGGMLVTNDQGIAERVLRVMHPSFVQTRDQNKYASAAHAFAEMHAYGHDYAGRTIANARALAAALDHEGFRVIASDRGFTSTHQFFLDLRHEGARAMEAIWQGCNILLHAARMAGDEVAGARTGLRITVQEVSRRGMDGADMAHIASLMRRAVAQPHATPGITAEVEALVRRFPTIWFSFDDDDEART
jgi:glycine hydroxymethyltransferase